MRTPNPAHVAAVRELIARSPFPALLSMAPGEIAPGRATLEIPVERKHTQLLGVVHGGVLASLIDTAAFWSVYFCLEDPGDWLVTVDLRLNFLDTAREGTLTATGRRKWAGATICYAVAEVADEAGNLLAHGAATLMVLKNRSPARRLGFPSKFLD